MINDDVLIKWVRYNTANKWGDWPEKVKAMKNRISECLIGFPGIGFGDLTLMKFCDYTFRNITSSPFIVDSNLTEENRCTDEAPLLLSPVSSYNSFIIEGIGCQADLCRDPDRTRFKWKDEIHILTLGGLLRDCEEFPILVLNGKPIKKGGGAGSVYHYFYRSIRDQRP